MIQFDSFGQFAHALNRSKSYQDTLKQKTKRVSDELIYLLRNRTWKCLLSFVSNEADKRHKFIIETIFYPVSLNVSEFGEGFSDGDRLEVLLVVMFLRPHT